MKFLTTSNKVYSFSKEGVGLLTNYNNYFPASSDGSVVLAVPLNPSSQRVAVLFPATWNVGTVYFLVKSEEVTPTEAEMLAGESVAPITDRFIELACTGNQCIYIYSPSGETELLPVERW